MAKRQEGQQFVYEALPAGTMGGEDERTDEERAFEDFVTGLGAEAMGVLRVGKLKLGAQGTPLAQSRSAHCFTCPIDQYTFDELLDFIRLHYGAGLFRVLGIPAGKKVEFNKIVEIAEDLKPKATTPEQRPQDNPASLLEAFSRMMTESQERTAALIASLSANKAPVTDPTESFMKMAALFQGMISSMVPVFAGRSGGDDLLGQLEKLAKVKELFGGLGGGDDGKESNFYDVVKTGLQSFGPALATLAMKGTEAQGTQTYIPAPQNQAPIIPGQAPNYNKPPPSRPMDTAAVNMKKQVDILVQNAKMGADPAQLAGVILDMTPDDKLDELEAMVQAPEMIDKMAALNPEVNAHRPFFDNLKQNLLTLLEETTVDTLPETAAAAGDQGASTA